MLRGLLLVAVAVAALFAGLTAAQAECASVLAQQPAGKFVVREASRVAALKTQVVDVRGTLVAVNEGASAATHFYVALLSATHEHQLAAFTVTDEAGLALEHTALAPCRQASSTPGEPALLVTLLAVKLGRAVAPQQTIVLSTHEQLIHAARPFPAEIEQAERQLLLLIQPAYLGSPYLVQSQTTSFVLPNAKVESYTESLKVSRNGDTIIYGPFQDVAPFDLKTTVRLHYENNAPFLTVSRLLKEYEVSHWGNVYCEEHVWLQHDGARFVGAFNRLDFARSPGVNAPNSVRSFNQILPPHARDVYYRDDIGNISTSAFAAPVHHGQVLVLTPRFPLLGGWKTQYYMGFNLPLEKHVFVDARDRRVHVLTVPFGSGIEDAVYNDVEVRVILPEGARNIRVHAPFPVEEKPERDLHFTYLDTTGRPVVTLRKRNVLASAHAVDFSVSYELSSLALLHEPLLLVAAFFVLFAGAILWTRLDFSLAKPAQRRELSAKELALLERYNVVHHARVSALASLETMHQRSASAAAYAVDRTAQLEGAFKRLSSDAARVRQELAALDELSATKLVEAERKADELIAAQSRVHELLWESRTTGADDKRVAKRLSDEQARYARLEHELDVLVTSLVGEV